MKHKPKKGNPICAERPNQETQGQVYVYHYDSSMKGKTRPAALLTFRDWFSSTFAVNCMRFGLL